MTQSITCRQISPEMVLYDPFVNFRIAPWSTLEETVWTDDYSNLFQVVTP